ncbi:MAG TPA: DUF4339 domain-containing protein [Chitinophagaceae bacterium]|jgi:chemotaxis protein histidine kinase CheA|nr:DUF4339 domain-containing protein [Chitinophagaceae bacterium]
MKKYYLQEGTERQGPFDLEELKAKNISSTTLIWYEGMTEPTLAGQLDELKTLLTPIPPAVATEDPLPTVEVKPAEVAAAPVAAVPVAPAPVTAATAASVTVTPAAAVKAEKPKPAPSGKKSTAWISWLLMLVVLGGAGYFVYQDMEKNKGVTASANTTVPTSDTATNTSNTTSSTSATTTADTATTPATDPTTVTTTTDPVTTTTKTTTATTNNAQQIAAQKAAAKKAEDEKKKKLAADAQKKADAEKKKQEAAQAAAAAKEMDMRNRWPNYISLGSLNYTTKGDGIQAFDVPLYNGTDGMLDKVTIRIEYVKKNEKKIFKTETITISNIPARTTVNGRAPESKKGEKVNVIITGISSRKLHFCYPMNNGNAADPYFCD